MKLAAILLASTLVALGADDAAFDPFAENAQEEEPLPLQAAFLFEWIELDHRLANKLVRKHTDQLSARELREQVGKLIDHQKAELVQTAYLTAKQRARSRTQSVDEHIYPTEYDPPEIPMEITEHIREGELIITPANPTAFDLRHVGTSVELEPDISADGKTIELKLAPDIVEHLCDRGVGGQVKVPEPLAVIKHPAFYVMGLSSTFTLAVNDFTLAGMFTPSGKADKRILLIVRARISY